MVVDFHNKAQEKKIQNMFQGKQKGGTFLLCSTIPYWNAYLLKNWLTM